MSDIQNLAVEPRERTGKGAARAARRAGRVPGVIYGGKKDPVLVTLDPLELRRGLTSGGFFGTLFEVTGVKRKEQVLPRDVQFHPVTDQPIHVDLLRVSAATQVSVEVLCVFINEEDCMGLRRGGVLNVVRHAIELSCRADAIPAHIDIDLAGHDIGDSIHISEIALPEGVSPAIADRDFTIATIAAPSVVPEEAADEEAEEEAALGEEQAGDEAAATDGKEEAS